MAFNGLDPNAICTEIRGHLKERGEEGWSLMERAIVEEDWEGEDGMDGKSRGQRRAKEF